MKAFTKGLVLAAAVLVLLPLAGRTDEKKLIDKRDPERAPQTDQEFLARAISCDVGEIKFGGPLSPDRDMVHSLLDLHRKRDDAPAPRATQF